MCRTPLGGLPVDFVEGRVARLGSVPMVEWSVAEVTRTAAGDSTARVKFAAAAASAAARAGARRSSVTVAQRSLKSARSGA